MRSKKYRDKVNKAQEYTGKNPVKKLSFWFDSIKTWQRIAIIVIFLIILFGVSCYAAFQQYVGTVTTKIRDTEVIKENELSCVDVEGYVNIVLLGVDSRDMSKEALKAANTDAIIVVSMNERSKDVSVISVFRDTYLKMGETSTYEKINAAYYFGGAQMAMKSLNQAMDINIKKYVLFNFKMVADLVDAVGGIEVNVKEREIEELKHYTGETARYLGIEKQKRVKKAGKQKLDGVQAVAYGRIRKGVGDDFRRTSRMRTVIKKVTEKLKKKNLFQLKRIMELCLDDCKTNLSEHDMIGFAQRMSKVNFNKSVGYPYTVKTGMLNGRSYVFPGNLEESARKLHKEVFEDENYEPSETLLSISNYIISQAGSGGTDSSQLGKYEEEIEAEKKKKEEEEKKKAKEAAMSDEEKAGLEAVKAAADAAASLKKIKLAQPSESEK